jgi:hypothetical protein
MVVFSGSQSVPVCVINLALQLFTVLYAQVDHRGLKTLVAEPMLNRSYRNIVIHPASGTGFAESVQDEVLAARMSFARDLNLSLFITAFRDGRSAIAAIQSGTIGNRLQFAQEMIFRIAFLVHKDPTLVWRPLPAFS